MLKNIIIYHKISDEKESICDYKNIAGFSINIDFFVEIIQILWYNNSIIVYGVDMSAGVNMKELTLQEQKEIALKVLCQIDEICKTNDIRYSLAYGTLLGAVRHKDFIPWDDDVDIMMPRADYLKFVDYCKNNSTDFELACGATDPEYGYVFAKACDKGTTVVPGNMKWQKNGIQVDIFPVENLGADAEQAGKHFSARRLQRELLVAWNWSRYEKNPNRSLPFNAVRLAFFLLSRFVSNKKLIASVNKYYEAIEENEYMGIVCGAYRSREIMPASIYKEYTDILFEGKTFKAISKYDEYLKTVYGDYMKLPPEEKRVTHHNFKAYWN